MEWELNITYILKKYKLKAVLEYHSAQIMRVRVVGMKRSLLLENDWPVLQKSRSTRGMKWKLREGSFDEVSADSSALMLNIMYQLEYLIKKDYPKNLFLFD